MDLSPVLLFGANVTVRQLNILKEAQMEERLKPALSKGAAGVQSETKRHLDWLNIGTGD